MTGDESAAEQHVEDIDGALRKGVGVFVSGPPGSGRQTVLRGLAARHPEALVLDLLSLQEADAPAVAMLETQAAMGQWDDGAVLDQDALFECARDAARALDRANRLLVLKVPGDWWRIARADESDDRVLAMGEALLRGLTTTRGPIVLITDQRVDRRTLLRGSPCVVSLPLRRVTLGQMGAVTSWGELRAYADALEARARGLTCSMVGWRLAVGLVTEGEAVDRVVEHLAGDLSVGRLAGLLAARMASSSSGRRLLERLVGLRVSVPREALPSLLGVEPRWIDLAAECLGYGAPEVRVAPEVRSVCERFLRENGGLDPSGHHAIAEYHRSLDGATSPRGLSQREVRQWAEKVHHLGSSGAQGLDEWRAQAIPGPQFFWDRGRAQSWRGEFAEAAQTYRACVDRFPDDDYGWHYLAFNLERAGGASGEVEGAFRRALSISRSNAWWNGRLVSFLVQRGSPTEARVAWREAVQNLLPEEDGRCRDAITAMEVHRWVATAWLDAGRPADARDVLRNVDPEVLESEQALRDLARRAEDAMSNGGARWQKFLAQGASESGVANATFERLRAFWETMHASTDGALPLPIVEASDGGLRCTWSYRRLRVQADLLEDGTVGWYARDHETGESEAGDEDAAEIGAALQAWMQRVIDA